MTQAQTTLAEAVEAGAAVLAEVNPYAFKDHSVAPIELPHPNPAALNVAKRVIDAYLSAFQSSPSIGGVIELNAEDYAEFERVMQTPSEPNAKMREAAKLHEKMRAKPFSASIPEVKAESSVIEKLVDAFLAWPLPKSVCSDLCVTKHDYKVPRRGTSLLTAKEARQLFEYLLPFAKAAGPSIPDGCVVVPMEPTQAMIMAYDRTQDDYHVSHYANARLVWSALLAASPTREEGK